MNDDFQTLRGTKDGVSIPSYSAIHHLSNEKSNNAGISHTSALLNSDPAWGLRFMSDLHSNIAKKSITPVKDQSIGIEADLNNATFGIDDDDRRLEITETPSLHDISTLRSDVSNTYDESLEVIDVESNLGIETIKIDDVLIDDGIVGDEFLQIESAGVAENAAVNPTIHIELKPKKGKKSKKFKLVDHSGISSYHQWLLSLRDADFEKRMQKQEEKAKQKRIEAEARKSVTKSDEIISESLAEILASQGHIDQAKKMYGQLMMKYPQKSIYFASKIDNI